LGDASAATEFAPDGRTVTGVLAFPGLGELSSRVFIKGQSKLLKWNNRGGIALPQTEMAHFKQGGERGMETASLMDYTGVAGKNVTLVGLSIVSAVDSLTKKQTTFQITIGLFQLNQGRFSYVRREDWAVSSVLLRT